MVKQSSSEWKYPPRIYEPIVLEAGDHRTCLKYAVANESPHKTISGDRYSFALMSKIQLTAIDCIYNSLHELCVLQQIRVESNLKYSSPTKNTFTFGDAATYLPGVVCRPISASEKRPLFTNAIINIEYVGDRLGTLLYDETEQVLTKAPNGNCVESINFYLAFKLGNIKNITIQRK